MYQYVCICVVGSNFILEYQWIMCWQADQLGLSLLTVEQLENEDVQRRIASKIQEI